MSHIIIALFFVFLLALQTAFSTQNSEGKFEYEHLENGRIIAQTGSSVVTEYRLKQFGEITLNINNFYFHDVYRSTESSTEVEDETAKFHDSKNKFRASIALGPILLMHLGAEETNMYRYEKNTSVQFDEDEAIKLAANGIGLNLGTFLLSFYPVAQIKWEYDLLYLEKDIFDEKIKYNVDVIQIIRQSEAKPGLYLDFDYAVSKFNNSVERKGVYSSSDLYTEVGWLTKKGTIIWYGKGNLNVVSELLPDATTDNFKKETKIARSSVGFSYPINFASDLLVKRVNHFKTVNVTSNSYIAKKRIGEDTVSFGLNLKEKELLIEFKISNTYYTRELEETVLITAPSDYAITDVLVGFGLKYRFGIR